MMKALRLSTSTGVENNKAALLSHLTLLGGTGPIGDPQNALQVQLRVHDSQRDTLLMHTKKLYEASLQHHPETFVSVIPLLPLSEEEKGVPYTDNESDTDISSSMFTAASMTADRGFDPLFTYVALGGTFDRLHAGHKLLLTTALFYASKLIRVGLTTEELLKKKSYGSYIEPFETRCNTVSEFLRCIRRDVRVCLVGITEPSGGTNRDAEVEAIVVSPETAGVVADINAERASNGLRAVACVEIPYVGVAGGMRISSTELRRRLDDAASSDAK